MQVRVKARVKVSARVRVRVRFRVGYAAVHLHPPLAMPAPAQPTRPVR